MTAAADPIQLELPLAYLGTVNAWLLPGDPLTLIDTGADNGQDLPALEEQIAAHGYSLEQIELLLITHHHLDHSGLAMEIKARSGAKIAAHRATAQWGVQYQERAVADQRFARELMAAHGVPADVIDSSDDFFARIEADGGPFHTDIVLSDGERITAAGRTLRVVFRPGHSSTDTLFIDEETDDAFVGDHLLASITSAVELVPTEPDGSERRQGLMEYLGNLQKTRAMALRRLYTGHGPTIDDHRGLIEERMAFHEARLGRVLELVTSGSETAFEIACGVWSEETAHAQPVLVTWEVLGHLDLLVNRGNVREEIDDAGRRRFQARPTLNQ